MSEGVTITEFLLARIAEDQYFAEQEMSIGTTAKLTRMNARVLAECAAKRAIVDEHSRMVGEPWQAWRHNYCATCADWDNDELGEGPPNVQYPCHTVRQVAAVYKDHPDYRQEWQ